MELDFKDLHAGIVAMASGDFPASPKTGIWKAEIERVLAANEGKPSREQLTLTGFMRSFGFGLRRQLRCDPALCKELVKEQGR